MKLRRESLEKTKKAFLYPGNVIIMIFFFFVECITIFEIM